MNTDSIILICTIAGLNVALFGALSAMVLWTVSKLDAEIKSSQSENKTAISRLDGHAQRIDQLYRTILDILKTKQQ